MAINKYLSIITLNVNGLMLQSKDISQKTWIDREKMTRVYAVYSRFNSQQKMYTDFMWRIGKKIEANRHGKKAGVGILVSDKIDFKQKP